MTPYYTDASVTVHHGDCLDVLRELPDCSVDAVVTDPPYGLEFMGKAWDAPWKADGTVLSDPSSVGGFQDGNGGNPYSRSRVRFGIGPGFQQWCTEWSRECLRVLKPGGHMLAFGGTRTWHRLACAVEDAGFEVRDSIAWLYGSGFPKSLDVSKAIDKAAGAEREVVGHERTVWHPSGSDATIARSGGSRPIGSVDKRPLGDDGYQLKAITAPATDDARTWQGWGTALKPAFEPIVVARKPLAGTVAATVLAHGTGALNIDGCRIGEGERFLTPATAAPETFNQSPPDNGYEGKTVAGRWPANVVLDDDQAAALDTQSGESVSKSGGITGRSGDGLAFGMGTADRTGHDDTGGASRFFYTAKADASERIRLDGIAHPTVKPLALMRWLVRLVTPPGGVVLEPFAGSGTTVEACILEGFACIAIEREADYLPVIVQRINRRRDPVAAVRAIETDQGLFALLTEEDPDA